MTVAQDWELDSTYYSGVDKEKLAKLTPELFIVEQKNVVAAEVGALIVNSINRMVGEAKNAPICFNPRHAVAYESVRGPIVAQVCFECMRLEVSISGNIEMYYLGQADRRLLDDIYSSIGLTLPVDPVRLRKELNAED